METKGKPVTTSVPSISIKFHANAEQLEELYASDEEHGASDGATGNSGLGDSDSSPLKYFPRLVKRSTSIDITPNALDASPPSDPWRFFSDIKGKITKSVEEKITEIKSRNQEDGSPRRTVKDSKDNSSVSDSEDLSESSISKTCGIVSTTEGAEMSSDDDDTPSIEKDKKTEAKLATSSVTTSGLRQRFRLLKSKSTTKEGTISKKSLATLYNINADKIEQALPDENEIESAVDALEEQQESNEKVLKGIEQQFDNIRVEENVVTVKEVQGSEVRTLKTVYAPVGFVDFRTSPQILKSSLFWPVAAVVAFIAVYFYIHRYSSYVAGFMIGALVAYAFCQVKSLLDAPLNPTVESPPHREILQVPAVREFQPLTKYEGWVNEFPEVYNPHTYHISQTQSVFLRLQGNLLRVSHTTSKVPKRALWNEPKIKPVFTHHRIYNLLGAQVALLPEGLAKKRHWVKKYPICLTLSKDQMQFETGGKGDDDDDESSVSVKDKKDGTKGRRFGSLMKKKRSQTLRFSKLSEENEELDVDSDNSRGSTPSPLSQDDSECEDRKPVDDTLSKDDDNDVFEDDLDGLPDDWGTLTLPEDDSPSTTKLYIFGRTDREKEDWFRRLKAATHKGAGSLSLSDTSVETSAPNSLLEKAMTETDYMKYMSIFNKGTKPSSDCGADTPPSDIQWFNAFVARVLFDCFRDDDFTLGIRDKIQRKLSSIRLPYFIEGLVVTELSLGRTTPLIHRVTNLLVDERGLWIDLDITYEGLVVLILQTKLNLMKLKQPPAAADGNKPSERAAMFNSDLEDSPESSSDEEALPVLPAMDSSGVAVGGSSNTSKKFMKMVDKIAESKFFQAATDNRYIKKAMEGVSNTELRLKVEMKRLAGCVVLNIPPPPSDRVWIGFRPTPELALSAHPIVGERNITFMKITSWIEKKMVSEFQKMLVIPNMEDFIVPVMSPKLPE